MLQRLFFVFLAFAAVVCAQVTSSSVTVTASRSTNLQPDQIVFSVVVTTPVTASRDDAVNALSGSGVTAANFISVYTTTVYPTGTTYQTVLQWNFTLTVSMSDLKNTVTQLSSVASGVAKKNNGISISFSVQSAQVSPQLQQSQPCPVAGLISDARAQAQTMASAASMTVGTILAMSSPSSASSTCILTVKFAAFPY